MSQVVIQDTINATKNNQATVGSFDYPIKLKFLYHGGFAKVWGYYYYPSQGNYTLASQGYLFNGIYDDCIAYLNDNNLKTDFEYIEGEDGKFYHPSDEFETTPLINEDGSINDGEYVPPTEGELAYNDIKNKYGFTDDEMLFTQNSLIALSLGALMGIVNPATYIGAAALGTVFVTGVIVNLPAMKDLVKKVSSGEIFDSSIPVNLVDLGSNDLDITKQAIKDTDLKFPMSSMAIGEIANNQGNTLVTNANIPISEQTSTSNEVSQFLYDTISKSISKALDIKDNIEKDLFSYKDFLSNFETDLSNFTPVNPSSKDILQRELDKTSSFDDIANKIIGDTSTGGSGTNLDKHIEGSQQDIKDKLGGGGSVVVPIIDGGGVNVDLSGVEGHLKTIGDSLVLIQQKNTQLNTESHISNLHNNVVLDTEVKTYNKNEYEYEVDNKTKIVRDGEAWEDAHSDITVRTHTLASGETIDIKKGYKKNIVASKISEKNLEQHYREEGKNESDIIMNEDDTFNNIPEVETLIEKMVLQETSLSDKELYFLKYINSLRVASGLEPIVYDSSKDDSISSSVIVDPTLMPDYVSPIES